MLSSGFLVFLMLVHQWSEVSSTNSSELPALPSLRIFGGTDVEDGTAPYLVALLRSGSVSCCGSIVGDRWILTAAHCVANPTPPYATIPDITVLAGTNNLYEGGAHYDVQRSLPYRNYTGFEDIALVRLNSTLPFGRRVQKIELAKEHVPPNATVQMVGWGFDESRSGVMNVTQSIDVQVVSVAQCQQMYDEVSPDQRNPVHEGNLCTYSRDGKRACYGDSGSPVIWNGMQVAVVDWNQYCEQGYPDVHASISYFYNWIQKTIAENDYD